MDSHDIVDTVNRLIETCKDGERGFQASLEHLSSDSLRQFFVTRAGECRAAAAELQGLTAQYGGTPASRGSASEAIHRGWAAIKGGLAGYTDLSILEDCERAEDEALDRYRQALQGELPSPVRSVVERQFDGVKRNHLQVRLMRDQVRAAAA